MAIVEQADLGLEGFNLLRAETFAHGHPFEAYARLREQAPVYRHPGEGEQPAFWALARHEDILALSRDNRRFTSREGFRLPEARMAAQLRPDILRAVLQNLLTFDPPEHGQLRQPLQPAFMPRSIKGLRPRIETFVDDLVETLKGRDEIEFVGELAAVVPIKTLCIVLGIPEEDEHRVFEWTNRLVGTSDPEFGASAEMSNRTFEEVFEYGRRLIEQRRREPGEDLLSAVANLQIDGEPIADPVRNGFFTLLLAAGNETTRNSLSGMVRLLGDNPDQKRLLVEDRGRIPSAIPELLRLVSPVIQMMRTAREDVEIGGKRMAAGERVVMLYGAGNTDPEVFDDPLTLDLARANANRHLAFGHGIHRCIGASIATLQLEILLDRLLREFPDMAVAGEPDYLWSNFVSGPKRMTVRLRS